MQARLRADDGVIGSRGQAVDEHVEEGEEQHADQVRDEQQGRVDDAEENEHLRDHGEGEGQVDAGQHQGGEKDREHLGVDRGADLLFRHAHLLHDGEAALVLEALGELLVVDDEGCGHDEDDAQQHAQEFKVPCNPAWDNTNIIQMRADVIAKRDHIGNYSRIGPNQWQHDEAIKYVNEGGENTYAVLTDREIAMRFYSIDE